MSSVSRSIRKIAADVKSAKLGDNQLEDHRQASRFDSSMRSLALDYKNVCMYIGALKSVFQKLDCDLERSKMSLEVFQNIEDSVDNASFFIHSMQNSIKGDEGDVVKEYIKSRDSDE